MALQLGEPIRILTPVPSIPCHRACFSPWTLAESLSHRVRASPPNKIMWPNVRGRREGREGAGWPAMAKLLYRFAWYICTIWLVAYITRRMSPRGWSVGGRVASEANWATTLTSLISGMRGIGGIILFFSLTCGNGQLRDFLLHFSK